MGSPEDEEGRYPDEGPRHEETIPSGFWMFDTPCTQALWEAVMGENPSDFKGPDRPVESVSWDQCQEFLKRLNARCEGLELKLPSEAQWEYACRAGTDTAALSREPRRDRLVRGEQQAVRPIRSARKPPTTGACMTRWATSMSGVKTSGPTITRRRKRGRRVRPPRDPGRLVGQRRAGVRAAYRYRFEPSYRNNDLGFRCAEFRAPGPVGRKEKQGAERAGERGGVACGAPGDRDHASGAGWINLDAPGRDGVSFAALTPVACSSDVEQIVLRTMTPPEVGFGHRSRQVWALGGVHDRGESREATHETLGQEEEDAPSEAPSAPSASASAGSRRGGS